MPARHVDVDRSHDTVRVGHNTTALPAASGENVDVLEGDSEGGWVVRDAHPRADCRCPEDMPKTVVTSETLALRGLIAVRRDEFLALLARCGCAHPEAHRRRRCVVALDGDRDVMGRQRKRLNATYRSTAKPHHFSTAITDSRPEIAWPPAREQRTVVGGRPDWPEGTLPLWRRVDRAPPEYAPSDGCRNGDCSGDHRESPKGSHPEPSLRIAREQCDQCDSEDLFAWLVSARVLLPPGCECRVPRPT